MDVGRSAAVQMCWCSKPATEQGQAPTDAVMRATENIALLCSEAQCTHVLCQDKPTFDPQTLAGMLGGELGRLTRGLSARTAGSSL